MIIRVSSQKFTQISVQFHFILVNYQHYKQKTKTKHSFTNPEFTKKGISWNSFAVSESGFDFESQLSF